ncbi:MAG: putative DNA binding domain-containing protein [Bacteroidaceae bacterium]|nr:putative DNA binding domain-containing protein [Bacteroidaceae bacterium]
MTIDEIKTLIASDETRCVEMKKTTGELKDGMHSLCAMLNSDGGYVIFGIAPKSLKIIGQMVTDNTRKEIGREIRKLEPCVNMPVDYIDVPGSDGLQLIVLHADKNLYADAPYVFDGKPYYKLESTTMQMPQQMYVEMLRQRDAHKFHWDAQVCDSHAIADLDDTLIRRVVRNGINNGRIHASAAEDTTEQLLDRLELLKGGKLINAAAALFAHKFNEYPQIELAMACFRGTTKNIFVDSKFAKGNLFNMLDAGITFLMNNLKIGGKVVGLVREEKLELPVEAMREALINALCHRQIERTLANVTLAIYDDRVEISNPGCLPPEIPLEKIKEPHRSYPRNKSIAQVLYLTAYLERWGTGVERIVQICKEYGVPEPEWTATAHDVTVTFWRKSKDAETQNGGNSGGNGGNSGDNIGQNKLTERQRIICDAIEVNGNVTAKTLAVTLAATLAVSARTIERELNFLRKEGYITKEGKANKGFWKVLK